MSLACVMLGIVVSCAGNYYKVTDPTTNKSFYTSDLQRRSSGSVTFTDARTGNQVMLQNSNTEQITKQQFENARNQTASAP